MSRLTSTRKQCAVRTVLAVGLMISGLQVASAQELLGRAASASANLASSRAAFEALPEPDRKAIQEALIWTGNHSGVADGAFGRQTFDAIAIYQQGKRKPASGVLSPAERADLQATAQSAKKAAGFIVQDDPKTGARIGVPTSFLPKKDANPNGGSRWQSADDRVTLDTRTAPPDATLASLYDRNTALQPGRTVTYKVLRPNFLVVAGETPTGKFYTRYDAGTSGLRGFSIGYDKALAPQVDRLAVAIANSFDPFPTAAAPTAAVQERPAQQPTTASDAGRRLIGTGIAVTRRRVVTTAAVSTCRDLNVGDVLVHGPQKPQVGASWAIVELPQDLPGAVGAVGIASAVTDQSVLIVGYTTEAGRPVLVVVPGTMTDEQSLTAPLQPGLSGAPVLDGRNRLVGIVGPVTGDGAKVAGMMTTSRYPSVPSKDLAALLPSLGDSPKVISGTSEIALFWRSALIPISCAP